jgi:predicted DCC family thiol-disulfide oxidoreductase YuxK
MRANRWFLYDGDCAFCGACARFIDNHVRPDARVVAWQFADLGALGLTVAQCDEAVQWVSVDEQGGRRVASGPRAIAEMLRRGGPLWRLLGRLLGSRPVLVAAGPAYRLVARHRDRMPGGTATCVLPADQRGIGPGL